MLSSTKRKERHRSIHPSPLTPHPRYEVSVLAFLVSADLVPGPVTLYVTPRAAAAAVPTVTVAAAVAAAVVSPAPEAGLLLWA